MKLLKIPEVAETLSVSEVTVRRLIDRDELPSVRVGRTHRIRPVDLDRFVRANLEGAEPETAT